MLPLLVLLLFTSASALTFTTGTNLTTSASNVSLTFVGFNVTVINASIGPENITFFNASCIGGSVSLPSVLEFGPRILMVGQGQWATNDSQGYCTYIVPPIPPAGSSCSGFTGVAISIVLGFLALALLAGALYIVMGMVRGTFEVTTTMVVTTLVLLFIGIALLSATSTTVQGACVAATGLP